MARRTRVLLALGVISPVGYWLIARYGVPGIGWSALAVGAAVAAALRLPGRTTNQVSGQVHGSVVQAGRIGTVVLTGPPAVPTGPHQVVVGEIPKEPPDFQARPSAGRHLSALAGRSGVVVVCAMTGQRGVGKSQLAAAYARDRIRAGFPLVAWIAAETPALVLAGMDEVGVRLGLRGPQDDVRSTAARVRSWLENRNEPALLVFDNATDADALIPFIPASGGTQVVITSTHQSMGNLGALFVLDVFTEEEALAFLAAATRRHDHRGADELAHELGRLPLALAQAAAVVRSQRLDYPTYLARLRSTPVEQYLVRRPGESYPHGAAEAILLSLDEVGFTDGGLAARMLQLLAVLSPDGVPHAVLRLGATAAEADAELERLAAGSVVTFSVDGENVIMHRLVQRVIRDRCAFDGTLEAVVDTAITRLRILLHDESEALQRRRESDALIRQVSALWEHCPVDRVRSTALFGALIELRTWAVRQLIQTTDLGRAELVANEVAADAERLLPPDDLRVHEARHDLATVYLYSGRVAVAIDLRERTAAGVERLLGRDHATTLRFRRDLAAAYVLTGRLGQAIALYESVTADVQRLPVDRATLVAYLHELASAYDRAGRPTEARTAFDRALHEAEAAFGADHPSAALIRENRRWVVEAEPPAPAAPARGVAVRPRLLGATVGVVQEGWVSGRAHAEISALRDRLDRLQARVPDDDLVVRACGELVRAYVRVGRTEEAVALAEHNLRVAGRRANPGGIDLGEVRDELALTREASGDFAEAARLYAVTRDERAARHGPGSAATLVSEDHLARVTLASGHVEEAVERFRRTLAAAQRIFGAEGRATAPYHNNLGRAHEAAGRPEQAFDCYAEAAAIARERLGLDHAETGFYQSNAARVRPIKSLGQAPRSRAPAPGDSPFTTPRLAAPPVIGE
ncbi:tetratricopeptide repeat protein [Saccharothrix carnea]|uniref:tetratricopeptide repeat protein n=1 Tax=Saccharothrix carnea TaxID=1280637 RepID=UPI0011B1EE24|nr:tetratricopeptide repeat protein [Saccharothrix carnea]